MSAMQHQSPPVHPARLPTVARCKPGRVYPDTGFDAGRRGALSGRQFTVMAAVLIDKRNKEMRT
jgi:hypothetical protein